MNVVAILILKQQPLSPQGVLFPPEHWRSEVMKIFILMFGLRSTSREETLGSENDQQHYWQQIVLDLFIYSFSQK